MSINKKAIETVSTNTSKATNNIVEYKTNQIIPSKRFEMISSYENKVVIVFIILIIYLFSALEEADWNVFSAQINPDDKILDQTIWNIYDLVKLISSNN